MSISKQGWHSLVNFTSYLIRFTLHYLLFGIKREINSTLQLILFHTLFRSLPGRIFRENLLKDKDHVFLSSLLQRVFVLIIDCLVFCFASFIVENMIESIK